MFTITLTIKLLAALTCFTAMYLTTEAAGTCRATKTSIPGLPGKDGRDGQPGRDGNNGLPGLPGTLNDTEKQQLKDDILNELRDELSMLQCCCNSQPTPTEPQCEHNATSCKELYQCNPATPSGYYNITTPQGVERVYCEMNTTNCGNITGGWTRAAFINMADPGNSCPPELTPETQSSIRMCRTSRSSRGICTSVNYTVHGIAYKNICGRALGYQFGHVSAFQPYTRGHNTTASRYAHGMLVTRGTARHHIWTFAIGGSKDYNYTNLNCPCALYPGPSAPSFVGESYFCESGDVGTGQKSQWFLDDPLWDSQGCPAGSTCCSRGGPWFSTSADQEVNDDIEVRICFNAPSTIDDLGLQQLEIYIN